MIAHDIEFHNVVEREQMSGLCGWRLRRSPASACRTMSPRGRWNSQMSCGVELRFVTDAQEIRLFLSTLEGDATVMVFQGDLYHSSHYLAPGGPRCLHLKPSEAIADLPEALLQGRFSPKVWRVLLPGLFPVFHHLETFGWDVRSPEENEKPSVRWLAYGSSITAGTGATAPHLNYVQQTATHLGVDALNLGQGGACLCEPELAEHFATRGDWNFATLEIGVNMLASFSPTEFEQRAAYLAATLINPNPGKPVVLVTPFLNSHHLRSGEMMEKQNAFTQILKDTAANQGCPLLDGCSLLQHVPGLGADGIHPFDSGMAEIARNLADGLLGIPAVKQVISACQARTASNPRKREMRLS